MARIFMERRDFDDFFRAGYTETAEYHPPVDVFETAASVVIVIDLPGVSADSLEVSAIAATVIVSGVKQPAICAHREAAFHLAERTFGRFTCRIRCDVAVDTGRAEATLVAGELHILLPRLDDRRGAARAIPVKTRGGDGA
jgi:HSP20 family protein